jgi:hypothetical protein
MSRLKLAVAAAAVLSLSLSGLAQAQPSGDAKNPGTASLVPPADAPPIWPAAAGPYPVTIEANPSLVTHTIYRPADLAPFTGARRLPIIAWGNGACSNAGLLFQTFLTGIASHGFVVIVSGPKDAPLPSFATPRAAGAAPTPPAPGGPPPPMTKDADLITALDWATKENARAGSPYFHKLNPDKIAVMGQSCGGLQATVASADPRVKTSIIWNSGTFPDGSAVGRAISGATKASLAGFHAPVAYINGGPHDAAYVNTIDDIKHINGVPVFFGWINVGHGGTYNHPGGGRFEDVGVAWLNWRLNGDKAAAKMFEGPDCTLCKDPIWHVEKKGMN